MMIFSQLGAPGRKPGKFYRVSGAIMIHEQESSAASGPAFTENDAIAYIDCCGSCGDVARACVTQWNLTTSSASLVTLRYSEASSSRDVRCQIVGSTSQRSSLGIAL